MANRSRNSWLNNISIIARSNIAAWIGTPRFFFVLTTMFLLCFSTMYDLHGTLAVYDWAISIPESVLFVSSKQTLLIGTLFLVFMSELPRQNSFQRYQWIRVNRSTWLWGQILYCVLMEICFYLFLVFFCNVCSLPFTFPGLEWSDNIRIANGGPETMTIFPQRIRDILSPIQTLGATLLLSGSYWFALSMIILAAGVLGCHQAGLLISMTIQLLPWVVDTFARFEVSKWLPNTYVDIFSFPLDTQGIRGLWIPLICFVGFSAVMIIAILFRIHRSDLLCDILPE